MKIDIVGKRLIISNIPESFGNKFIYQTPYSYYDYALGRNVFTKIEKIPFEVLKEGFWEFPTVQWIYPIMELAKEAGLVLENPEILETFKYEGGQLKNNYHLWEGQVDCIKKLTSRSHGIAILRTGAGKTTMISVLAKNMLDQGKKVVVMAPTNAVLHEIRDRFSSDFDIKCKYYFDPEKNIQFINPKGFFKSNAFWHKDPYWESVDCIIMDEVENCMNEKFLNALDRIGEVKCMYGFSGTAHKVKGIDVKFDVSRVLTENEMSLINQFGYTAWYEKPQDINLNLINIKPSISFKTPDSASMFDGVQIEVANSDEYHNMIEKLFTGGHIKNLFIPFTSRVAIKDFLNKTDRPVGMITGSGCQYRLTKDSDIIDCTLPELKKLMKEAKIEIALSSVSGFAGVDYPPNWNSSLANAIGNNANRLIQAAGRVARAEGKEFNLFYVKAKGAFPIFNKQVTNAVKLMGDYYSEGKVTKSDLKL